MTWLWGNSAEKFKNRLNHWHTLLRKLECDKKQQLLFAALGCAKRRIIAAYTVQKIRFTPDSDAIIRFWPLGCGKSALVGNLFPVYGLRGQ